MKMNSSFKFTTKADLDSDMVRFSLSLYNNKLFSKKAVDVVLSSMNELIRESYILYIQSKVSIELNNFVLPYKKKNSIRD